MLLQNIDILLKSIAKDLSAVGGSLILVCGILFGCGTIFMDETNETFRKAKAWIVKALVVGMFVFGAGTILSFVQTVVGSSGFGI